MFTGEVGKRANTRWGSWKGLWHSTKVGGKGVRGRRDGREVGRGRGEVRGLGVHSLRLLLCGKEREPISIISRKGNFIKHQ